MHKTIASNSVLHFSRWGNKSFSAFNSLHRVVKVCVLSSACFMSLGTPSAVAQTAEGTSKNIDLEEINVDAEAKEIAMESELTRIIAVVSESEIARSSAQSLAQLLKSIPGLDVRQRGAHSTQADLSIRAGSFDQILILLNGINISDPQTGHNNLNIPISLNAIARIEILEGAGLRYNSEGAFAGAINIVTKKAEKTGVSAEASHGAYNFWNTEAELSLKQKNLSHTLTVSNTSSDGYRENTDFDTKRLYYRSAFEKGNTTADFQLGYIENGFGSNSFYSSKYPHQYEQMNNVMTSLKVSTGDKVKISPKVYYKRSFDRFELFREEYYHKEGEHYINAEGDTAGYGGGYYYSGHNYHQTDVWGIGSDFKTTSAFGATNVGIDLRNERIRSNQLGEEIAPIAHPKEDSIFYTREKSRTNYNVFVNHTYYYQDFVVSGNLLLNYNGIAEEIKPYFGIDMAYKINEALSLKASANESFRMPTFTELYYTGEHIGNPDLKPESALTYDFGINYRTKAIGAHASVFHRRGKDIIDWVKAEASDDWKTIYYSGVNTTGLELSATMWPEELSSNLSFIKNINTSFTFNDSKISESSEQGYISKYTLDYLKYKFTVSGDFTIYKKLTASFLAQNLKRINATDPSSKYESFWLCDASLRWESDVISPFVEVSNIFDTTYYDYNDLPQAGRWAMIGIKVKL